MRKRADEQLQDQTDERAARTRLDRAPEEEPLAGAAALVGNRGFAALVDGRGDRLAGTGRTDPRLRPAVAAISRRPKAKAATVDFSDEPLEVTGRVTVLDASAGGSAVTEINNQVEALRQQIQNTQTALLQAVNVFGFDQAFASSEEGEAKFDAVFLSYAAKTILKEAFGALGEKEGPLPGVGKVYEITMGLVEKLQEEDERAAKARGSRAVAQFLGDFSARVTNGFNEKLSQIPALKDALAGEYAKLSAAAPGLSTPTAPARGTPGAQPAVAGEAAAFLTTLKQAVSGVKAPTMERCLQAIVEEWVGRSEGKLMSRGGGDMYVNGRIVISMKVDKDGESYKVSGDATAKLRAPRADHVIDSMKRVLGTGKSINDLSILKVLEVDVEDEVWGFNDHYAVSMTYRDPKSVESVSTIPSPVEDETLEKAPSVQRRVRELIKLEDVRPTEIKAEEEGREV